MTRRERLTAQLARRQEWAEKARARSSSAFNAARQLADQIPLGQPILVGHHSERHARRDAERIRSNMGKGVAEQNLAGHHRGKAGGLERQLDQCVFSDDADAVAQLEARIADNEQKRDRKKLVNRLFKKGDAVGLTAMGYDIDVLRRAMEGNYSWDKQPFPAYELTNLGARIRADKVRIEEIQRRAVRSEQADAAGGVLIEGGEHVRVTFAEKPPHTVLDALHAAGFTWGGGSWCGERAKLPAEVQAAEQT